MAVHRPDRSWKVLLAVALLLTGSHTVVNAFVSTRWQGVTSITTPTTTETSLQATHYPQVFVAGGSKGVGRLVIDELLARGSSVTALVRDADVASALNALEGVKAIVGDAFDQKTVENAMDGCDAVITTLGGSTRDDGAERIDYVGNSNVIESAGILGIPRIILVTSVGCGSSKQAAPAEVFAALQPVLEAKERAENLLIKYYTNSNWTIIRPGGLKSEPATGAAILTQDPTSIGTIHRADVARLVVQCLESPKTERLILTAVDPSIASAVATEKEVEAFAL